MADVRFLTGQEAMTKCHVGKGEVTCMFLGHGSGGFQCLAVVPVFRSAITERVLRGEQIQRGEACADPFDSTSESKGIVDGAHAHGK